MDCLYLEIEGQSRVVDNVDQSLMKNGQINHLGRMTEKESENKYTYIYILIRVLRINSNITRDIFI